MFYQTYHEITFSSNNDSDETDRKEFNLYVQLLQETQMQRSFLEINDDRKNAVMQFLPVVSEDALPEQTKNGKTFIM